MSLPSPLPSLVMVPTSIALGISIGASSVIARSVGNRQLRAESAQTSAHGGDEVARLGTHSLIFGFFANDRPISIVLLAIDPLFLAMGAALHLLPLIHSYLDIVLTTTMICGSIMRASGSANIPGAIMTIGAGMVNLILDPIFIFGWFGFPAMELAGAATAMTLTRFGTLVVALCINADNLVSARHTLLATTSWWIISRTKSTVTNLIGSNCGG